MPRCKISLLIEIMGTKEWDIISLRNEYNSRCKNGATSHELANKMRRNPQFEVVGSCKVTTGYRNTPRADYRLYAVKPQFYEVFE